ncbi:MAG TPA: hypothetical protein VGG03_02935 [Thermoanaerobaculia bacterium]|jgi:hypothetical protein
MKGRLIRAFAFLAALTLSGFVAQAAPSGWTYQGCWSPYPNCAGGKHAYTDASGNFWQCNSCSQPPSTASCYKSGNLNAIGYWCS